MDFEDTARKLINVVGGEMSDENVQGVMYILSVVVEMNNLNWEQWITEETNESLAQDNMTCNCGALIKIIRDRNAVYVDIV